MSQQNAQTGIISTKPPVSAPAPANKTAPLPLDPAQLRQVSGGLPKATW